MDEPTKESREKALAMLNEQAGYHGAYSISGPAVTVLARTLDKLHGRTPVDPLVDEAQSIADDFHLNLSAMPKVEAALQKALRRGMELAPKLRMPTKEEIREAYARYYEITGYQGLAESIRAGSYLGSAQPFHTAVIEMLEKINEREGV